MNSNPKTHHMAIKEPIRTLSQILTALVLKQMWQVFHSIKIAKATKRTNNKKKETRRKTIQQEFIDHCAVVIQSRFRGYLQRKRYRAFLPIYRRVKELFLAVYSGWKIRKILKLQPIRSQINDIKLKIKNNQVSSARIAKRELIGDIDRLSKKGRWIEILNKFRMGKMSRVQVDSKENSSLYANIKSISIKNIFKKEQLPNKEEASKIKKFQPIQKSFKNQENKSIDQNYETRPIRANNFDDMPIKINKQSISVCETESEPIYVPNPKNVSKKQYLKKGQKQQSKLNDVKTARNKLSKNSKETSSLAKKEQRGQTQLKQLKAVPQKQLKKQEEKLPPKNNILSQSQISKSSQISKKKIQITLLATPMQSSLKSNTKSLDESTIDMKAMKESIVHLDFTGLNQGLTEILNVYKQKYLGEKNRIKQKIMVMQNKYTGRDCKGLMKDF